MAVDPRLMMTDATPIAQGLQSLGQGIGGMMGQKRQMDINKLAGRALMGDQGAMEGLMVQNPELGMGVQQSLAQQQKARQEAALARRAQLQKEMRELIDLTGQEDDYASARQVYEAGKQSGLFGTLAEEAQRTGDEFDEEDFLFAKSFSGGQFDEEKFERAKQIRSELRPIAKEYREQAGSFESLLSVTEGEGATPADQLAAIFQFMKSLDPSSVVQKGEQQMVQGTTGVGGLFENYVNKLKSGNFLNKEQLRELTDTAYRAFKGRAMPLVDQVKFYRDEVIPQAGLDASYVIPSELSDFESTLGRYESRVGGGKAVQGEQMPSGKILEDPETGKRYRQVGPNEYEEVQ